MCKPISFLTVLSLLLMLGIVPLFGQFQISNSVMGSGAGVLSGASHGIKSTAGQVFIGSLTGANYHSSAGFWYAAQRITTIMPWEELVPIKYDLLQNYPNPFNPSTMIRYALPLPSEVRLDVYNVLGQRVAILVDGFIPAGYHTVQLEAGSMASGMYIYRLSARSKGTPGMSYHAIKRMILVR